MKTKQILLASLALFLLAPVRTFGVIDQSIQVQGTNLVLSWPSLGNEYYMIQYWPNLQPGTSWVQLTNCYRANSTNRTTYIIPCCELAAYGGSNSMMAFSGGGDSSGNMAAKSASVSEDGTELWAMPADGFGSEVPLAIYPPGYDFSRLVITKKLVTERIRKSISSNLSKIQSASLSGVKSLGGESGGPMSLTSGGCDCPDMGFFRVFHVPNFLGNITNYIFSGPTFLPIDFADYITRIDQFEVLLNGQPTDLAVLINFPINGTNRWGVGMFFDKLTNGNYQIQLQASLRLDDVVNDFTPYLQLSNKPVSISVSNIVMFPQWDDLITGTNYTFRAQSVVQNTDWSIDVYDYFGNLVNYQTGSTTNGLIEWTWDLTDLSTATRDNLQADPYFDPVITLASPQFSFTNNMPLSVLDYPYEGDWIIGYQDRVKNPTLKQYYVDAMEGVAGGPAFSGIATERIELVYGEDAGPDPITAQTNRNNSWNELKAFLAGSTSRNFYYQGHGFTNIVGGDYDAFDAASNNIGSTVNPNRTSSAYLTTRWVKDYITFNKFGAPHPYRFVFLDGCQTSAGDWPQAWGIAKTTNSLAFYQNTNRKPRTRPSAFVGWNVNVGGGPQWGFLSGYRLYRTQWMFLWSQNNSFGLLQSLQQARSDSGWISESLLNSALDVYGYPPLKFNEYNHRADWSTQ